MINYGFLIGGILFIAFYFAGSFWLLLLLGALAALFTNMAWTGSEIQVSKYLPDDKKGEFMGIFEAARDIGFDLAPMFYGFIALLGLKVPFLMLGFLLLAAWLVFVISNREKTG
jgi:sugar phosphate permease